MRRLLREEVAAACGDDVMSTQSGAHLFCFHVRMPPARKSAVVRDERVADPLDEVGTITQTSPAEGSLCMMVY